MTLTELFDLLGLKPPPTCYPVTHLSIGFGQVLINGRLNIPMHVYGKRVPGLVTACHERHVTLRTLRAPRKGHAE
ncbi:hypothetical protein [Deinococcus kurensis]|uniref:hypothetical protein n=1 Tax=Deinococcus kurensis TaxID=2662757 RepID=UPI0012D3271A|nr:hypothetical protein [Deinococcus kurensis]